MIVSCFPLRVPRALFGPRGWSAAQGSRTAPTLGFGAVYLHAADPSSRHFPTTIIMTISPLTLTPGIAEDAGVNGCLLGVWPYGLGCLAV